MLSAVSLMASVAASSAGTPAAVAAPPMSPRQLQARVAIHDFTGAIPVLCYHGIYTGARAAGDDYSVSQTEFASQIAMLTAEGFHAVSVGQYARFAAGNLTGLPSRPILITFDDGRLDSFQRADPILARYGMRATMFVIVSNAAGPKAGYLGWATLRGMVAGGRWDIQEHADAGHVLISTGPDGRTGPFYANLRYSNGLREKFTAFKRRVSADILAGRRQMAAQIPGFEPLAFAVPYSNYGQMKTNYPPIPKWEIGWLRRTFKVIFVQDRRVYNRPGSAIAQRYGIHAGTTAAALRLWLVRSLPRSAWTLEAPSNPPAGQKVAPPARPRVRRLHVGKRTVVIVFRHRDDTVLTAIRRQAGRHRHTSVRVSAGGRLHDRRLRPGTRYLYRVFARDSAGIRSKQLRLHLRTRASPRTDRVRFHV